ncbi:hypothetical protein NB705_002763 [Xanthomonas sacchari]|nr:hypothetical protein [Xanthomonas sacchari]
MCSNSPFTASVAEVNTQAARDASRCARSGPDTSSGVRWQRKPRGVSSYHSTSFDGASASGSASKSGIGASSPSQRPSRVRSSRARAAQASKPGEASRSTVSGSCSRARSASSASKPSRTCGLASSRHCVPRAGSPSIAARNSRRVCSSACAGACRLASAPATWRLSATQSRASSCSGRMPKPSPKKFAASSGNWCASSITKACAPGRISPKPSCFSARSASSRWWLTTTRSAACARCRACTTKHSPQNGHSVPRQLSTVEVTSGSSGESSASASSSAMSPKRVRPLQATMR